VTVFGSPARPIWGRLVRVGPGGLALDVHCLSSAEVLLGRDEGEVRFTEDDQVSHRHALLCEQDGAARLEDLSSKNGVFLRLRGERQLEPGDVLRIGRQLLRFEGAPSS
jgi:pSer/pThr/pTyr-binding forkhead associated (FHA) protein